MKMKTTVLAALSAVMFAGCVSEQERQAIAAAERARQEQVAAAEKTRQEQIAAAEKARQEQIAAKEREEVRLRRQKAIDEINTITDQYSVLDMMEYGQDEELRKIAESRLRDITVQKIASSTNIVALKILAVSNVYEQCRAHLAAQSANEKTLCEPAFDNVWQKMYSYYAREVDGLTFGHRSISVGCEWQKDTMWGSLPEDVQKSINVACEEFVKDINAIQVEYRRREIRDADATIWRNERVRERLNALASLKEQFRQQALVSVARNGRWTRKLKLITARYAMPELRMAAKSRLEALMAAQEEAEAAARKAREEAEVVARKAREEAEVVARKARREAESAARKAHIAKQGKLIEQHYNDLAEHNYKLLLSVFKDCHHDDLRWQYYYIKYALTYAKKRRYGTDYYRADKLEDEKPWQKLVGCRHDIPKEDAMGGSSMLEEFGGKYLPNAYANYEKIRVNAEEVQQMFNEEFPEPYKMRSDMPTWNAYEKLLRGLMKARTQSLRRHDELCHFYLLHKIGAVSSADLAKIDSKPICIWLLEENHGIVDFSKPGGNATQLVAVNPKVCEFANKYAAETYGLYQKFMTERTETQKLLDDLQKDIKMMDIVRFELSVVACREKIDFISQTMNVVARNLQAWHMDYKLQEKDAAAIARLDHECALKWKGFAELLPSYLKERANGPLLAVKNPMNKFYRCDVVRPWHCPALGFYYYDGFLDCDAVYDTSPLYSYVPNSNYPRRRCLRSVVTGMRIDMPRFRGYRNRRYVEAYVEDEAFNFVFCPFDVKDGRDNVFGGFSDRSPFLWRLNDIDAGKAVYVGWEIEGVSRNPQGGYGCSVKSFGMSFDEKGFKLAAKIEE